jgi:sigma-B regulation protein RsbU (phosphoserine phosphatase)
MPGASTDVSLRLKLMCFVGLPVASIFIALIVLDSAALRAAASSNANEHATLLAQRTAQVLNGELAAVAGAADTLATVLSKGGVDLAALPGIGEAFVRRLPLVAGVVFGFDQTIDGIPRAGYTFMQKGQLVFEDIAATYDIEVESPWYRPSLPPGPGFWTAPFFGEVFGDDIVSYSTRFETPAGVRGFVVADVTLGGLFSQLEVAGFSDVRPTIVTDAGQVIETPWAATVGQHNAGARADDHVIRTAEMPAIGWTFKVAISHAEVFGEVEQRLLVNAVLLSSAGLVVLCVLLITGLRFARRIEMLSSGVASISAGDLDVAVYVSGRDEVGQLAVDFNSMTSKLRETVQQVANEVSRRAAIERDLSVARDIQQSMLPRTFPPFPGRVELDLHATLIPADHVAGDFYDYWLQGDTLTVLIADVSGHGIAAALVMAMARRVLRDAAASGCDLVGMVQAADVAIAENNDRQMFVTATLIELNLMTGAYTLINAGHPEALRVTADGASAEGRPTGPLLGVVPNAAWATRSGQLSRGEAVVLYTDGITEAMNADDQLLETAGLQAALHFDSARQLCGQAMSVAEAFQDGDLVDDLTVVALCWLGPSQSTR